MQAPCSRHCRKRRLFNTNIAKDFPYHIREEHEIHSRRYASQYYKSELNLLLKKHSAKFFKNDYDKSE